MNVINSIFEDRKDGKCVDDILEKAKCEAL